ncbi:AAA family ATPase [Amphibacillus cookii]|uniref:AAA family ATPase n=1 Tax=Amphibacillus cookii TaxID=767787 RepID=UPI00195E45B8|nr:AAA family ATPase [Amphibacillus cookii]MBM7540660.1 putative ATPase/DNA-binding NarL/FixJ family response regulator [Amphibacillus cookii]
MKTVGYSELELAWEIDNHQFIRAIQADSNKILLRRLTGDDEISEGLLIKEFQIRQQFDIPCMLTPLEIVDKGIAFENIEGLSLSEALKSHAYSIEESLKIAIQLVKSVEQCQHIKEIKFMVKPDRIILSEDLEVKILPMVSTKESLESKYQSPEVLLKKNYDQRSELYKLGMLLYEVFARGKNPFSRYNNQDWTHNHIAVEAIQLIRMNRKVPKMVNYIVMTLLSKNPENRYQTCGQLLKDLTKCLVALKETEKIDSFRLSIEQLDGFFKIPKHYYGRDNEICLMYDLFQDASNGSVELVFLHGPVGIGKTTLINNQFRKMIYNRAYFTSGEFDQTQNHTPYQPLITAFQDVVSEILTQTNQQMGKWKEVILDAIGDQAHLITNVIPELTSIIGEQTAISLMSVEEKEQKFIQVFQQFIQVFINSGQPLVLFLDNFHLADQPFIKLIRSLIMKPNTTRLMLILGCRDDGDRAQFEMIKDQFEMIDQYGVRCTELELLNLSMKEVNQLVADTLHSDPTKTVALTKLIYKKTAGNLFYTKQLLKVIYANDWIMYNNVTQTWEWDQEAIQSVKEQKCLINYMIHKIDRLPKVVKKVLKIIACFGYVFERSEIERFSDFSVKAIADAIHRAEKEGLIFSETLNNQDQRYHFFHNQIQQVIYDLNSETEKKRNHLELARFFVDLGPQDDLIFKTVDHFNKGRDMIQETSEKEQLIELNYKAGSLAKESNDYVTALHYYRSAVMSMEQLKWDKCHDFCFNLYLELAESEYYTGHEQEVEILHEKLLQRAHASSDSLLVYSQKILNYINCGKPKMALEVGIYSLEKINIDIPREPTPQLVREEMVLTRQRLAGDFKKLRYLPNVKTREIYTIMKVLFELLIPSFLINKSVFSVIICKLMRLIIEYGKYEDAPAVFAVYGSLLCLESKAFPEAYSIRDIALSMVVEENTPSVKSKTYMVLGSAFYHYGNEEIINKEEYLKQAIEFGGCIGSGNIYTSMAILKHTFLSYEKKTLVDLLELTDRYMRILQQFNDGLVYDNVMLFSQFILCMKGRTSDPLSMDSDDFNEKHFMVDIEAKDTKDMTLFNYYLYKTQICYLNAEYSKAVSYALKADNYVEYSDHYNYLVDHYFYKAIVMLKCWKDQSGTKQLEWNRELRIVLEQLAHFRKYDEKCFAYKEWLIRAEYANVFGYLDKAEELYEQAIASAEKNGNRLSKALTNELTGQFYHERGKIRIALIFLKVAIQEYNEWGAGWKARFIEHGYFDRMTDDVNHLIIKKESPSQEMSRDLSIRSKTKLDNIIRASEVMSKEINFSDALKELMCAIKRESLAEKVILFTKQENVVIVTSIVQGIDDVSMPNKPIDESKEIPHQVIRYVDRTKKLVNTSNNTHAEIYKGTSYIMEYSQKSTLCMPLFIQGQYVGILYLENRWIANLFSEEQFSILKFLGTQAMFVTRLIEPFKSDTIDLKQALYKNDNVDEELMIYDDLTDRELEIINLMAAGHSNKEIAKILGVKIGTIKVHIHNIFSKLDVNRRTMAIFKANQLKLIN